MKPVLSLWSYGGIYTNLLNGRGSYKDYLYHLNMYKVSAFSLLKAYGEVHLVTDLRGAKFLKKIPFTTVDTSLEILPKDISILWSLGKIYAYKILADKKEPFIHVDADYIILSKLPEKISQAEIFANNPEYDVFNIYNVKEFYNIIPNKYLFNEFLPKIAYNMSIFGGRDFDFIKYYAENSLRLCLDKENIEAIRKKSFANYITPACIVEQYLLSSAINIKNKKITTLLEYTEEEYDKAWWTEGIDNYAQSRAKKFNCFHFGGTKNCINCKEKAFINNLGEKIFN